MQARGFPPTSHSHLSAAVPGELCVESCPTPRTRRADRRAWACARRRGEAATALLSCSQPERRHQAAPAPRATARRRPRLAELRLRRPPRCLEAPPPTPTCPVLVSAARARGVSTRSRAAPGCARHRRSPDRNAGGAASLKLNNLQVCDTNATPGRAATHLRGAGPLLQGVAQQPDNAHILLIGRPICRGPSPAR